MSLDAKQETGIEVPTNWRKCTLRNCPYYLALKGYEYHFWDAVYLALQQSSGNPLQHHTEGPCKRPCEASGATSPHDIILTHGTSANDEAVGRMIRELVASMPEIEIIWE